MWSRRQVVRAGTAIGSLGMLAGCMEPGELPDRNDGQVDLDEYDGNTLTWFLRGAWIGPGLNAEWATWFGTGAYPGTGYPAVGQRRYSRPGAAWDATMARGAWGPWINDAIRTGDLHYGLYEGIDIADDEIVVTLRDDAAWSNGDPVTGRDVVPLTMAARLTSRRSFDAVEANGPTTPIEAITEVEWTEDTARFVSAGGSFAEFMEQDLWGMVTRDATARGPGDGGRGGVMQHTRMEPYESWFDRLVELWEGTRDGTIDPWDGELILWTELAEALPEPPGGADSWYEHFHDAANCVVTGAFKPASIMPQLIALEPNPEFYAADQVDADYVLFPVNDEMEVHWGAMVSGDRDYLRHEVLPDTAGAAPDAIDQRQVPTTSGLALAMNHQTTPFGSREVRQALCYLIDTERIAANANAHRYEAVTVPGGHAFQTEDVLGSSFVEDTLTAYPYDTDLAAERLEAAGYREEGGDWVDGDGSPLVIPLISGGPQDYVVQTVFDQFDSFGLSPEQVPNDPTSEGHRPAAWSMNQGVGFVHQAVGQLYVLLAEPEGRARTYGVFSADQIEAAEYADEGGLTGGIGEFVVEAPPVGDPDGSVQSWEVARLARECATTGSQSTYRENLERLAWIYNWHLPVVPIANEYTQHFVDAEAWEWGDFDDPAYGIGVDRLQVEDLLALGWVRSR